ncbi:MAG: hypothetical protein GY803_24610 [Chloroflexi bacterium]|nr:hypothetical protein [Chloroflexota bacterium]
MKDDESPIDRGVGSGVDGKGEGEADGGTTVNLGSGKVGAAMADGIGDAAVVGKIKVGRLGCGVTVGVGTAVTLVPVAVVSEISAVARIGKEARLVGETLANGGAILVAQAAKNKASPT